MSMTGHNIHMAEAYYLAMGRKDASEIEKLLHPDVAFIAPMAQTKGKEALMEAAHGFVKMFDQLTIHAKFEEGDKAVIVYDLSCPAPIGNMRAVALMSFKEGLISSIELFYDPRPFLR